ncbi:hypothetical protein F5146DRAFT_1116752 [Armillaria mellea]|nr:hypothetical protein F5146DRAFT_1116752 [Armillaria mellea]
MTENAFSVNIEVGELLQNVCLRVKAPNVERRGELPSRDLCWRERWRVKTFFEKIVRVGRLLLGGVVGQRHKQHVEALPSCWAEDGKASHRSSLRHRAMVEMGETGEKGSYHIGETRGKAHNTTPYDGTIEGGNLQVSGSEKEFMDRILMHNHSSKMWIGPAVRDREPESDFESESSTWTPTHTWKRKIYDGQLRQHAGSVGEKGRRWIRTGARDGLGQTIPSTASSNSGSISFLVAERRHYHYMTSPSLPTRLLEALFSTSSRLGPELPARLQDFESTETVCRCRRARRMRDDDDNGEREQRQVPVASIHSSVAVTIVSGPSLAMTVWYTLSFAAAPQTATSPYTSPFSAVCQPTATGVSPSSSATNASFGYQSHHTAYGTIFSCYTGSESGTRLHRSQRQTYQLRRAVKAPAARKYSPGDCIHISDILRPVYEILPAQLSYLKQAYQKRQINQVERRVNPPFDALNCETLSKPVPEQL